MCHKSDGAPDEEASPWSGGPPCHRKVTDGNRFESRDASDFVRIGAMKYKSVIGKINQQSLLKKFIQC